MTALKEQPRVDHGWWDAATCRKLDPDMWCSELRGQIATARHICIQHCPVTLPCYRDALQYHPVGVVQGGIRWDKHGRLYSSAPAKSCLLCHTHEGAA